MCICVCVLFTYVSFYSCYHTLSPPPAFVPPPSNSCTTIPTCPVPNCTRCAGGAHGTPVFCLDCCPGCTPVAQPPFTRCDCCASRTSQTDPAFCTKDTSCKLCEKIIPGTGQHEYRCAMKTDRCWSATAANCTGSGDAPAPVCFAGSAAYGVKRLEARIKAFDAASRTGVLDLLVAGMLELSCTDKKFTTSGQSLALNVSDCVNASVVVDDFKYCSDQDTSLVSMTYGGVSLVATLSRKACPQ